MFVAELDLAALRQGDIIAEVTFPLPKADELVVLGKLAGRLQGQSFEPDVHSIGKSTTEWLTAQVPVTVGLCAVLSQCCDVDPSQKRPPPSFVLCRLVEIPEGIRRNHDSLESLKLNVDPYGGVRPFYQLFYIAHHPKLGRDYVADYGQAMTIRWGDYARILRRKILQMDDLTRAKFRVKAGAFFGRATKEDADAGLADPWKPQPSPDRVRVMESFPDRIRRALRVILGRD